MHLLQKILWEGKGKWQVVGAVIGAFIGLFLMVTAIQLYFDMQRLMAGDANPDDHFIQINKKVSVFNTFGVKSTFTDEEIAEIESQPFVLSVGAFTPNRFKANASSKMMRFYTELFFEAVPDDFLDLDEPRFRWREGQAELPIILSRDYLALYNFGFAPSQGLPQFTANTIQKVSFDINVSGNGLRKTFEGRIVGFSDRINSVLVPYDFMTWANNAFGSGQDAEPSRLILQVENPLSRELTDFIQEKGYEVSSGRLIGGQFSVLLKLAAGAIATIGFLLLLLSALVFLLNFQLVISRSAPEIRLLLQVGYKAAQISRVLVRNVAILFAGVLGAVLVAVFGARFFWVQWLSGQGFELPLALNGWVFLLLVLFSGVFLYVNFKNIDKNVRSLF
ncbi:MAG: FtsX-like permease family protein [Bacteroidetes bacterium]|nr:MAG: FtsX-like permease family protein [Bacteroidota bacterium]